MEWFDIKEALPPINVLVITRLGNEKSVGKVTDYRVGKKAGTNEPVVLLSWKSQEPHVFTPTHWMHLPK